MCETVKNLSFIIKINLKNTYISLSF